LNNIAPSVGSPKNDSLMHKKFDIANTSLDENETVHKEDNVTSNAD